jgi:hypothetical protein
MASPDYIENEWPCALHWIFEALVPIFGSPPEAFADLKEAVETCKVRTDRHKGQPWDSPIENTPEFFRNYGLFLDRERFPSLFRRSDNEVAFEWFLRASLKDALMRWPSLGNADHAMNLCIPIRLAQQQPVFATIDPFRTGAPGRPTASHLVLEELKRRIANKEVKPSVGGLSREARSLEVWWDKERKTDPSFPPMTWKSIRNTIRQLWKSSCQ